MTSARLLLCASFLLLLAPAAQAQLSTYATIGYTNFDLNTPGEVYLSKRGGGLGVGAFYNLRLQSRLTVGADLRLHYSPGNSGGTAGALALRLGYVPHEFPLRPYFQIGGGVVTSSFRTTDVEAATQTFINSTNTRLTNGTVDITAGLDIRLTDSLDLRAIELSAAAGKDRPDGTGFVVLDAGLVYHFR